MKRTCLYDAHLALKAKMVTFAGFEMPLQYESIINEHKAVRQKVGMFDVSHMGKIKVIGEGATVFINRLVTNNVMAMIDGQAIYSPVCYEDGGTVDDILIYRFSHDYYWLVVNAANKDKDIQWFIAHRMSEVVIEDITDKICQIAIQGPSVVKLFSKASTYDVASMAYYHFISDLEIDGVKMMVSRTGYTGEDGYELYFDRSESVRIWSRLNELGAIPCGLGARDTLRFEAGMPLYGNELSEIINPLEAGLKRFVDLDGEDFIGKEALGEYNTHPTRRLVGFQLIDRGLARHGASIRDKSGEEIGFVTTGYKSPTLGVNIGMAMVPWDYDEKNIKIEVRNKWLTGVIVNRRFLHH